MLTTLKNRMRGVSMTETLIMMPVFLMLTLGALQYALIYEAKSSLDYATFMSARAGAVDHARKNAITYGLAKSITPLYSPEMDAAGLLTTFAKARVDVEAFTKIKILNPTKEAFKDFGVKNTEKNLLEIPNEMLHLASTQIGKKSKVNIQDANLLKVQVLYGYKLKVPFVNSIISTIGSWFTRDPIKLAYYSQKRIPILATATVRMQSRAWDNSWVTKKADVDKAVTESGEDQGPLQLAEIQRPWKSGPTGQGNPSANPNPDTPTGSEQPGNPGDTTNNPPDNNPPDTKPPSDNPPENDGEDKPVEKPKCETEANATTDEDREGDKSFWGDLWDKVKNSTSKVYKFIKGFWEGIKTQIKDIAKAVTNPTDTAKGIYQLAKAFIDNPQKTVSTIMQALGQDLTTLLECGAYDQGRILGEYVSPAFMFKLATMLTKFPNLAEAVAATKKDLGCASFTAGTPILIPGGSIRIEALKKGSYVNSRDEYSFENSDQLVTHLHSRQADGFHRIQTELGDIEVTAEHPFWMQGKGWIKAKDLNRGDPVATVNGDMLIYQNQYIDTPIQVYNFTVDKTHNYFAGSMGAWVHNAGPNCGLSQPVKGYPGILVRNAQNKNSSIVNRELAKQGYNKPYASNTIVTQAVLVKNTKFVRVFTPGKTGAQGKWVMRAEDIKGLTAQQIKEKYALPFLPKNIVDVDVPEGTAIRFGEVGPNFGSKGGNTQFELLGRGTFSNPRLLP